MTALAGFWRPSGGRGASAHVAAMLKAQLVYASEEGKAWDGDEIAVGRALHRLLPEDRFDRGPIHGGGGDLTLVADLRLDNREELAGALGLDAAALATLADAGLLMRALERWGGDAVERLNGDFAFALWDRRRRSLTLARDFLGQRPLHYHRGRDFIAFASMPKGLHALPEIPYGPDRHAAADFLVLMPEKDGRSFFEGIEKVPGAHVLTFTPDGVSTRRHWPPPIRPLRLARREEYEEALRERMDEAVRARLRGAERRVGAQLSAGLDSGSVAATAARLLAPSGGEVWAFTAVPSEGHRVATLRDNLEDEGPLAAATAALYPNMHHRRVRSDGRTPVDDLDRAFFLYERPPLNLCNFQWTNAIRDEAKALGLSVMLGGSMGNMSFSFSGMERLPQLLREGRLATLIGELAGLRRFGLRYGTIGSQLIGPFLPQWLWKLISRLRGSFGDVAAYSLIHPDALRRLGVAERAQGRGMDLSYRPRSDALGTRLWAMGWADPGNYNKGALGGWGLDLRDPTADRALVEFCLSVPLDQYLAGGVPRSLARRAMADRLPAEVVNERRKGQQAADWWLGFSRGRDRLVEEVGRLAETKAADGICDVARMRGLLATMPSEPRRDTPFMLQYRIALLRGVSAGHFLRKASRSNA